MKLLIVLALLAQQQPHQTNTPASMQQTVQEQKTACSMCHTPQTKTKLTPEAQTLCDGCFERLKYCMIPS